MKTIILNKMRLVVDDRIDSFEIFQKDSSNVEFFGIDPVQDKLIMQFRNGTSYIYSGLSMDLMKAAMNCESIGKFFSSQIAGKFESQKIAERLIVRDHKTDEEIEWTELDKDQVDARLNRTGQTTEIKTVEVHDPLFDN